MSNEHLKFYSFLYSEDCYKWTDLTKIEFILVKQRLPALYIRINDKNAEGTYNCSVIAIDGFDIPFVNDIKELANKHNIIIDQIRTDYFY